MVTEFGTTLRYWRNLRGFSQLQLGLQADVSAKHISFLENGKAQPSRDMIIILSTALDIPFSERNVLLNSAGFCNLYTALSLKEPSMQPIKKALNFTLKHHNPFPAIVLDEEWNILMLNSSAERVMKKCQDSQPDFTATTNLIELTFHKNGLRSFIDNWEEIICYLLQRRYKKYMTDGCDEVLDKVLQDPDVPVNWQKKILATPMPMISIHLTIDKKPLQLFSTLATFGTAVDITANSLIIEQYFPVNAETRLFFEELCCQQAND